MALANEKLGMTRVEVKKDDLITQLRKNRNQHLADYEDAMEEYKIQYRQRLRELSAEMKKTARELTKIESSDDAEAFELPDLRFKVDLVKPNNYLEKYDRQIAMREANVQETVIINEDEFDQYWLDNWSWKQNFEQVTSHYKNDRILRNS